MNNQETYKNEYFDELVKDKDRKPSCGEWSVTANYFDSKQKGYNVLTLEDLNLWKDNDYKEFMDILDKGNVKELVLADKSTALMEYLTKFDEYGWEMKGMTTYEDNDQWTKRTKHGIILRKAA